MINKTPIGNGALIADLRAKKPVHNPLPESAVELAHKAYWATPDNHGCDREAMRNALTAALPAIREAVVGEFKPLMVAAKALSDCYLESAKSKVLFDLRTALAALTEQENRNGNG